MEGNNKEKTEINVIETEKQWSQSMNPKAVSLKCSVKLIYPYHDWQKKEKR